MQIFLAKNSERQHEQQVSVERDHFEDGM